MAKRYQYRQYVHGGERRRDPEPLPERLPLAEGCRLVRVFVEGYEDVAFWRGIFDKYESPRLTFEISVPVRRDLAKGKKALLAMVDESGPETILCMDSDFDYLFGDETGQSRIVNHSPYIFHTHAYATENFLCYAPSLHNVCVKATKNDTRIFDFDRFLADYSRIIYPLFLWYVYSAHLTDIHVFTLLDFKSSVKLNYLEVERNGTDTLAWLRRQVEKRQAILESRNGSLARDVAGYAVKLARKGVRPENAYLFMQGHTLMDNVVIVMLNAVSEKLRYMTQSLINRSDKRGVALSNEQSNYCNCLHGVRDSLLYNENYKECFLYRRLDERIARYVASLEKRGKR